MTYLKVKNRPPALGWDTDKTCVFPLPGKKKDAQSRRKEGDLGEDRMFTQQDPTWLAPTCSLGDGGAGQTQPISAEVACSLLDPNKGQTTAQTPETAPQAPDLRRIFARKPGPSLEMDAT